MSFILLVEDDISLGQTLRERLEKEGHKVSLAGSFQEASSLVNQEKFDLVILDVGLPDGSGFELAKKVREKSIQTPFLFVTAESDAESRLQGYELGAEEYIPKPFHLREFLLRVRHVLENHSVQGVLEVEGFKIDLASMTIESPDGACENIPFKDCQVLKILIERSPHVVSRDELLNQVWGEDKFPSTRTVDNCILRLRQYLGLVDCIRSVRGVGYQWVYRPIGKEE